MAKPVFYFSALLALFSVSACAYTLEMTGKRTAVNVDIAFVRPDGSPVANAKVYIAEMIGGPSRQITEVLWTDQRGHVTLFGSRCLPTFVGVQGGGISVTDPLPPSYQVIVKPDSPWSLEKEFGEPSAKYLGYSLRHPDCG